MLADLRRPVTLHGEADVVALFAVESVVVARAGDEASVAQPRAVDEVARHREMGLEAAVVGGVALLDTELVGERTIDGHAVERLVQHRAREGGRVPAQRHGDHGAAAHLTAVRGIGHLLDPPPVGAPARTSGQVSDTPPGWLWAAPAGMVMTNDEVSTAIPPSATRPQMRTMSLSPSGCRPGLSASRLSGLTPNTVSGLLTLPWGGRW